VTQSLWFRDALAWRLITRAYLPSLAVLNLAWEVAHVRLYTIWTEATPAYIAFSVLHCTLGDVLIGGSALLLALIALREGGAWHWRWGRIAALTALGGTAYTVFSEWTNIKILRSWTYAESMPRVDLAGFEIGVSPLAQWLVIPPLAVYLARKARTKAGLIA
jgi:hypothetical protein